MINVERTNILNLKQVDWAELPPPCANKPFDFQPQKLTDVSQPSLSFSWEILLMASLGFKELCFWKLWKCIFWRRHMKALSALGLSLIMTHFMIKDLITCLTLWHLSQNRLKWCQPNSTLFLLLWNTACKENIEMCDSFICYKLIYIHINSGRIQEFGQNLSLTDHEFTINK